ncbi:Short-chain dehydrogenase/reductase SDR like protein [Aduncisulcus paluster]|uniref:Short-chain dehydrogenase/reductase SDR like protein n=1 Tax=Aduncisulcus paluster TaxID=2918883 RepID=A0ABQ5KSG5_9EUKA|nr:Short-chain dehydrogenase/reductase SDR like protein [Aduncisulcus paluster]
MMTKVITLVLSSILEGFRRKKAIEKTKKMFSDPKKIEEIVSRIEFFDATKDVSKIKNYSFIKSGECKAKMVEETLFFNVLSSENNVEKVLSSIEVYPTKTLRNVKKVCSKRYKMNLDGKEQQWALVTGASGGIGSHVCSILAACGVPLIISGRNTEKLAKVALKAAMEGVCVRVIKMNVLLKSKMVSESTDMPSFVYLYDKLVGSDDIRMIYMNAGGGEFTLFEKLSHQTVQDQIELNFSSHVHLARYFMLKLKNVHKKTGQRRVGSITFTSSIVGVVPFPMTSLYSANKHAITGFSRALRMEGSTIGVDVACACPGVVNGTHFYERELTNGFGMDSKKNQHVVRRQISRASGTYADEAASEIVVCASKAGAVHLVGGMAKGAASFQRIAGWGALDTIAQGGMKSMVKQMEKREKK